MINLIVSLLAGAVGWWVTNFLLRPVQKIEELRQTAHEELIYYANIGKGSTDVERDAARNALRRVAAGLMAAADSASRLIRWWVGLKGWNLQEAGNQLLVAANTLDTEVEPNLKIVARDCLDRALCLPPAYSADVVLKARSALQIPL